MNKRISRITGIFLAILMLCQLIPVGAIAVNAESGSLAEANYVYGETSNAVRISDYSDAAYNSAMALLEKSSDLGELLSSGNGTEASPFLIRNFNQLRLLFFWMNFANCNVEFRFIGNGTSFVTSSVWNSLLKSYGTNASSYNMTGSVYARLAADVSATVTDGDCTSLFECAVNMGVNGNEYARYLTLISNTTFNFSTNGHKLTVTLTGGATEKAFSFMYSPTGKLNLFDDTKWGEITVNSTVRYTEMLDFSKRANFCIPFYIADFPEITAKNIGLKAVGSTGTSAFLLKGGSADISSSTLEYSRHTSSTKAGMSLSLYGVALDFSNSLSLDAVVFNCDHPNSSYSLDAANISIEHTDIPEGITSGCSRNISINYSKVGGGFTSFFGSNAYVDLHFVDLAGDIEFWNSEKSAINHLNVIIDHCTATHYRDNTNCESVFITDSTFNGNDGIKNIIAAQKVTVHASNFKSNLPGNGVICFERLSKGNYEYVRFTDTQIVNSAVGYAVEFPKLFGYVTAKDEFGDEYVVSYPTITDKHFYFRNCSLSIIRGAGSGYAYQDPTNLQLDPDASIYEIMLLGIKILTENCTDGRMAYVNSIGMAVSYPIKSLAWGDISGSGHKNTEELLTAHSDILSMVDTSYSSFVIENNNHEKYTLTYNANGATSFPLKSETQYDDGYINIAYGEREVYKTGYDFLGWSTDPTATKATYKKGDRIYLTHDTVLYAVLIKSYLNVTYQFNGGTENGNTSYTQTVKNGTVIKINKDETGKNRLCDPKQQFKVVAGWSDLYNPINVKYTEGTSYTVTDDVTFYAVWGQDTTTYKVQFRNKDGGVHTNYLQYGGTKLTVPKGCPAPEGKRFVKWYDETKKEYYKPGDVYSVGAFDTVMTPIFEVIPDSEIMHTIASVNVLGLALPTEEDNCVTDGSLIGGTNYTAKYKGGTNTWQYTDSKGYTISMSSADTFKGGTFYTVYVDVTSIYDNYVFDSKTEFKIENTAAKVVSASGKTYTIAATFRCAPKNLIRNVTVTGLDNPLAGMATDTSVTATSTSAQLGTATVKWYNGTTPATKFDSGKVYHAEITISSGVSTTKFSKNVTVTVNGTDANIKQIVPNADYSKITIVLQDMSVDKTAISYCSITGVPEAWVGSEPEYPALQCATNQYTATISEWAQFVNGTERDIYSGSSYNTFTGNGRVRAYVNIHPSAGYALSSNPTVIINGQTATKYGSYFYIEFDVRQPEAITSLSISGVPSLMEGEHLDFNPNVNISTSHTKIAVNSHPVEIYTDQGDKTVTPIWTLTDRDNWTEAVVDSDAVVQRNGYYLLYLAVTHDAGYVWDVDLMFHISINNDDSIPCYIVGEVGNTLIVQVQINGTPSGKHGSVSGTVTSYGNSADSTFVQLTRSGEKNVAYEVSFSGAKTDYTISGVEPGTYTMTVSKTKHVTREYTITVSSDTTQNAEIRLCGDMNGDGEILVDDYSAAVNAALASDSAVPENLSPDENYIKAVADFDGDGYVDVLDVVMIERKTKHITA